VSGKTTPKEVRPPTDLCNARKKRGGYCENKAGKNTAHLGHGRCWLHGGAEPHAEVNGQVVLARREAAVMGVPLDIEPHNAILECIRIAAGEVQYASDRIAELEPEQAIGRMTSTHTRPLDLGKEGEDPENTVEEVRVEAPALHIWIVARRQAMDRLVQYSAVAIKAGIEERRVKLAESQGQLLVQVIRGVLQELGVLNRPEVPAIVRRQLTLVAGQAA
jgi:hypothetical protein